MSDSDKPPFEPNLVMEQATLQTFAPRKGRKNSEGDEVEPPTFVLSFRVPVDRVERYLTALTKAWKNERGITIGLAFVEQLELMARRDPITPAAADKNGHGDKAAAKDTESLSERAMRESDGGRGKKKRTKKGERELAPK